MSIKLRVLIVCRSFYPVNSPRSFRATELAKEFARQGHEVEVVTLKDYELHPAFEKQYNLHITDLGNLKWKKVAINGSGLMQILRRALARFPTLLFEYPEIELIWKVKRILKNKSEYDLMISIAVPYPIHWGVAFARSKNNHIATTWVADCGDPYMLAKGDSFRKPFYFKYLEKYFSRKADFISIPNINMKANHYPEFHNKIVEIPQGFNLNEIEISKDEPVNPMPTFAFAGSFLTKVRNPTSLLEYLCSVKQDFKFIVYTQNHTLLQPFMQSLGNKLEIRNFIPRTILLKELSKMDFLINIGYDPVHQIPSKLIDYYLSGRPVLNFIDNTIDASKLNEFLNGNYSNRFHFENPEKYRIQNVCSQFIDLISRDKI